MSDSKEETEIVSLTELNQKVDSLADKISSLLNAPKSEVKEAASETMSVQEQVNKAVEEAKAKDAADKEKAELHDRVSKLEGLTEKKPMELRKITKIFWGNE